MPSSRQHHGPGLSMPDSDTAQDHLHKCWGKKKSAVENQVKQPMDLFFCSYCHRKKAAIHTCCFVLCGQHAILFAQSHESLERFKVYVPDVGQQCPLYPRMCLIFTLVPRNQSRPTVGGKTKKGRVGTLQQQGCLHHSLKSENINRRPH